VKNVVEQPVEPAQVLAVEVRDYKSIGFKRVDVKIKDGVLTIQGPNRAGKSNFVDALELGLRNNRFLTVPGARKGERPDPAQPVRHGQVNAEVKIKLRGYSATLKIDADGKRTWRVVDDSGASRSEVELMTRLFNAWSFSADYFDALVMGGKEEEWRKLLLEGRDIKLTNAERAKFGLTGKLNFEVVPHLKKTLKYLKEIQSAKNVSLINSKRVTAGIEVDPTAPLQEPNFASIAQQVAELNAEKADIDRRRHSAENMILECQKKVMGAKNTKVFIENQIKQLQQKLADNDAALKQHEKDQRTAEGMATSLVFKKQDKLDELTDAQSNASEQLGKWQTRVQKANADADVVVRDGEYRKASEEVEKHNDFIIKLAERIDLDIPGVKYDGETLFVEHKGGAVAYQDENEATRRMISIRIAAGSLGEVPFLIVRRGESFTRESWNELKSFAHQKGLLIVVEVARDELEKLGDQDVSIDVEAN
jgi:hypothetical protein